MCVMESPTQKYGYLDVKQSSKVKGRKLKNWKRRWVVLTKMTDMSSDQIVAKIDLYENETVWLTNRSEKTTYILDHVTSIQKSISRTHPHAFEVIQKHPELVFSGNSEIDSFSWILTLQQIFTPHMVEMKKGSYKVTIQQNADASRWDLSGEYSLSVSPACVSLNHLQNGNNLISWGLSTLMRFNVTKEAHTGDTNVLVIECGKNGPTGESKFGFISNDAPDILKAIRQSICLALAQRQNARRINIIPRGRSVSESNSEKLFQNILDSSPFSLDVAGRDRSESDSSGCTLTPVSPFPTPTVCIDNPLLSSPDVGLGLSSRRSNTELESLNESEEHDCENTVEENALLSLPEPPLKQRDTVHHLFGHSSLPKKDSLKVDDPGYSVIKDVNIAQEGATRSLRNTIGTNDVAKTSPTTEEPPLRPPPRRKRSSTTTINVPHREMSFSKKMEDRSDVDSTRSYSLLSSSFDSAKFHAERFVDMQKSIFPNDDVIDSDLGRSGMPTPGSLNRRRSSSTPDLEAFWNHRASLENVYKELDSIRAASSQKFTSSPSDIPPALPARPFNLLVPTFRHKNNQAVVRLKKSFFFNRTKLQRENSMQSKGEGRGCCCNYPYISNDGLLLSAGNDSLCGQCGGSINLRRELERNLNTDVKLDIFSNSNSSLNIYASIPDITDKLGKRRRSSDITRPVFLSVAEKDKAILEKDPAKFYSLRQKDKQNSRNLEELTFYGSDETVKNVQQQGVSRLSTGGGNDPLISFFMDGENSKSNAVVTGQLTGNQPQSDDLLICPDSPKNLTKKDLFTEDIFTMESEPTDVDNDKILKPQNFQQFPNLLIHTQDSLTFDRLTPESDMTSNPVLNTCLHEPKINSMNSTIGMSSPSVANWSNNDPFQACIPLRPNNSQSTQVSTPSPLLYQVRVWP